MAFEFYVTDTAWITEIHFWASATVTGSNHQSRLYEVIDGSNGTLIPGASEAFPSPLQAGWNTVVLDPPIELEVNQRYRAGAYFTTDNGYTATGAYWSGSGPGASGITNGILVAPQAGSATGGSQGSFTGSDAFPNGQFNSGNYWIDVTVTDVAPGPAAPVVSAGTDIVITLGQLVSRTATATNSPTSWEWNMTAGPGSPTVLGTAAALSWTPSEIGTYTLVAEATNATGTGTDTITVTVNAPPPPPGKSFGPRGMFAV